MRYMNSRSIVLALSVIALSACVTTKGVRKEGGVEKISLIFDWPADLSGTLSASVNYSEQNARGEVAWAGENKLPFKVSKGEFDLKLELGAPAAIESGNPIGDALNSAALMGLAGIEASDVGDYVGPIDASKVFDGHVAAFGADLSGVPEAQVQEIQTSIEQRVRASTADLWNVLVGTWIGREFAEGETTTAEGVLTVPGLGEVETQLSYTLVERVACPGVTAPEGKEPPRTCAILSLESKLNQEKVAEGLAQLRAAALERAKMEAQLAAQREAERAAAKAEIAESCLGSRESVEDGKSLYCSQRGADAPCSEEEEVTDALNTELCLEIYAEADAKAAEEAAQAEAAAAGDEKGAEEGAEEGTEAPAEEAVAAEEAAPAEPALLEDLMTSLVMENRSKLVVDFQTLQPYKAERTQLIEATVLSPSGEERTEKKVEEKVYVFSYGG